MRVLVVDADPIASRALCILLESAGHTTCAAAEERHAMSFLWTGLVDAILLDVREDGWDVLRRKLRSIDWKIVELPVVIVTALSPERIREQARSLAIPLAGVRLVVSKPVDAEHLLKVLGGIEASAGS